MNITLSDEEFRELKCLISFAIDEGYNTNLITKDLVHKFDFTEKEMIWFDKNSNIGEKLL